MPFNPAPDQWIDGYTSSADELTFARDYLQPLTESEADSGDGDVRKIFYAFCLMMFTAQEAKDTADRPVNMRIQHNSSMRSESPSGITRSHSFFFTFETAADAIENEVVKDEPT